MTKIELLDGIARERARLLGAVAALGDEAATLKVTEEGWTPKDVLAHLTLWGTAVAFGLGATVAEPAYMKQERERREAAGIQPPLPPGDEANALAVAHYQRHTLADVRAELESLADAIVDRVKLRSDEDLQATDAVPWAPGRPLWHFVAGDTVVHWSAHTGDIERSAQAARST
jgi:hypothetical protein